MHFWVHSRSVVHAIVKDLLHVRSTAAQETDHTELCALQLCRVLYAARPPSTWVTETTAPCSSITDTAQLYSHVVFHIQRRNINFS